MRKRARVIYNPTSGREALKKDMIEILNVFEQAGYETSAFATTADPDSASNEAYRAARDGFDLVVAAGGDGTINQVINGISGLKKRPKMAIIPAGTTNDYARALHVPREDPLEAAKVVLKQQTIKMDIGKAGTTYFVNIAGGGRLTELTYDVPSDFKSLFGYLAYIVKGAELLPQIRPFNMDLKYDSETYSGKASMFFLALTNSIGGLEQIVPDASLNDGKFTMIIVKTSNMVEILHLITLILNGGRHVKDPRIVYRKVSTVSVKPQYGSRIMINLDGEYGGDAPMIFKNLKQHIDFYANLDDIPEHAVENESKKIIEAERRFVEGVKDLPDD